MKIILTRDDTVFKLPVLKSLDLLDVHFYALNLILNITFNFTKLLRSCSLSFSISFG